MIFLHKRLLVAYKYITIKGIILEVAFMEIVMKNRTWNKMAVPVVLNLTIEMLLVHLKGISHSCLRDNRTHGTLTLPTYLLEMANSVRNERGHK